MQTFTVMCTCGHDISLEADNQEEAVQKMKKMMDDDEIKIHFDEYHEGEDMPNRREMHAMIEQNLAPAEATARR